MTLIPPKFRSSSEVRRAFLEKCKVDKTGVMYEDRPVAPSIIYMSLPHNDTFDHMARAKNPLAHKFLFLHDPSLPILKLHVAAMHAMLDLGNRIPDECMPMTIIEKYPDLFENVSAIEEDEMSEILASIERYIPRGISLIRPTRPVWSRAVARACLKRNEHARAFLTAAKARSDWILGELVASGAKSTKDQVKNAVGNHFSDADIKFLSERSLI